LKPKLKLSKTLLNLKQKKVKTLYITLGKIGFIHMTNFGKYMMIGLIENSFPKDINLN